MSQVYAKLSDYVRKKDGKRAIVIYSAMSKDRALPGIGYHVRTEDFDPDAGLVLDSEPNYKNINIIIRQKIGEVEAARLNSISIGKKFHPGKAIKGGKSFLEYAKEIVTQSKVVPGTMRNLNTQLDKLQGYDRSTKVVDITADWVAKYMLHVKKTQKGPSGLFNTYQFLSKIYKRARKAKLITEDVFSEIEIPKPPVSKKIKFLYPDQLVILDEYCSSEIGPTLYRSCLWQLYACYSGLRWSDWRLETLKEYLDAGKIELTMTKTRGPVLVPIYPKLENIMKKLIQLGEKPYSTVAQNKYIKLLGPGGKPINKEMSTHFGRHTFGVYLADNDVPPQIAQKLLGHKNIRETMIYYEVTPRKVFETVKKLLG